MTVKVKDEALFDGAQVEALVKMDILEIIEKPQKFICDFLALHAIGPENVGTFILDQFEIELVGIIKQELLFEVKGVAKKVAKKKKPTKRKTK